MSRLSSEKIQGKCGMKLRFVTNSLDHDTSRRKIGKRWNLNFSERKD